MLWFRRLKPVGSENALVPKSADFILFFGPLQRLSDAQGIAGLTHSLRTIKTLTELALPEETSKVPPSNSALGTPWERQEQPNLRREATLWFPENKSKPYSNECVRNWNVSPLTRRFQTMNGAAHGSQGMGWPGTNPTFR